MSLPILVAEQKVTRFGGYYVIGHPQPGGTIPPPQDLVPDIAYFSAKRGRQSPNQPTR